MSSLQQPEPGSVESEGLSELVRFFAPVSFFCRLAEAEAWLDSNHR